MGGYLLPITWDFRENKESIHVFFKYDPEEFEDLLSNLSKKNLFILGFFGEREGERMIKLHLHSTFRKMFECLDQIKEFDPDMTYYIVDKEKSLSILDREHAKFFYWDLFDPERVEWKFERDLYREKIHDFKKAMDNGDYVEKETFTW